MMAGKKTGLILSLAFLLGASADAFAGRHSAGLQPMGPPSKVSELFYAAVQNKNIGDKVNSGVWLFCMMDQAASFC